MIVNPTAEKPQLADEIRKWTGPSQVSYADALPAAQAAIDAMEAELEQPPSGGPPGWRGQLVRWIMDTFIVSREIAEAGFDAAALNLSIPTFLVRAILIQAGSTNIIFRCSVPVTASTGVGFSVTRPDHPGATFVFDSIDGNDVIFTTDTAAVLGEVSTYTYNPGTGDTLHDTEELAAFTDRPATARGIPPVPADVTFVDDTLVLFTDNTQAEFV